jgi:hypothetical protein
MEVPPAAWSAENDSATQQGHMPPKSLIISSFANGIVGLFIGKVSVSWLDILVACVCWGILIWALLTLIAITRRWSHKPRFIIWWSISSVPSLIIGTLTYIVRAVLALG